MGRLRYMWKEVKDSLKHMELRQMMMTPEERKEWGGCQEESDRAMAMVGEMKRRMTPEELEEWEDDRSAQLIKSLKRGEEALESDTGAEGSASASAEQDVWDFAPLTDKRSIGHGPGLGATGLV